MHYLIYLLITSFTFCFVMYTKYQFEDMKDTWQTAKRKWHPWGAGMRVIIVLIAVFQSVYSVPLIDIGLAAMVNVILWDVLVNIIALKVKWNYVGFTAQTDRWTGKKRWVLYAVSLLLFIILKFFILKTTLQ